MSTARREAVKNFLIKLFPNATKAWAAGVGTGFGTFMTALFPEADPTMIAVLSGVVMYGLTWLLPNMKAPS